jgi:hypothetical protein
MSPRRKTISLAAGGAIVAVALVALTVSSVHRDEAEITYRDDTFGWSVTIPSGWRVIRLVADPNTKTADVAPTLRNETFIANGPASAMDGRTISIMDETSDVPGGGVLVGIGPASYDGVSGPTGDDFGYPATTDQPQATTQEGSWDVTFQADGLRYEVFAVFGSGVPDEARRTVQDMASSIIVPTAPPPPPEGAAVARFPDEPTVLAWRLGPADRFPPGSVVRLRVQPAQGTIARPRELFIVTPAQPMNGVARWMVAPDVAPCTNLSWDGKNFRCGDRAWHADGSPVDRPSNGLTTYGVYSTYEEQLIASWNAVN